MWMLMLMWLLVLSARVREEGEAAAVVAVVVVDAERADCLNLGTPCNNQSQNKYEHIFKRIVLNTLNGQKTCDYGNQTESIQADRNATLASGVRKQRFVLLEWQNITNNEQAKLWKTTPKDAQACERHAHLARAASMGLCGGRAGVRGCKRAEVEPVQHTPKHLWTRRAYSIEKLDPKQSKTKQIVERIQNNTKPHTESRNQSSQ